MVAGLSLEVRSYSHKCVLLVLCSCEKGADGGSRESWCAARVSPGPPRPVPSGTSVPRLVSGSGKAHLPSMSQAAGVGRCTRSARAERGEKVTV
jgi:hypothetical protein